MGRSAVCEPGVKCRDKVGVRAWTVGDGHDVPDNFLVGLGSVDGEQQAGGFVFEVGQGEADELGDPQAEAKPIAGSRRRGHPSPSTVDGTKDPAEVRDVEGSGLAPGRGTDEASQAAADLPDRLGGGGVVVAADAVAVGDRADGQIQGGDEFPIAARSVR